MVQFHKTNYQHAMDNPTTRPLEQIHIGELGASAGFGDVLESVKGELSGGASHVELVFTGVGKGSLGGNATTPEMFGKVKREEIRQLAKINDATISTHASIKLAGVAGFVPNQNKFDDSKANDALQEIKRTIDFAADAAGGGAVVVHTNEFPREVTDKRFAERMGEERSNVIYLADPETGQVYGRDVKRKIDTPVWKKDSKGNFLDRNNQIINPTDYNARELANPENPQWEQTDFDEMKKQMDQWNKRKGFKKGDEDYIDPISEYFFAEQYQRLEQSRPEISRYHRNYQALQTVSNKATSDIGKWASRESAGNAQQLMAQFKLEEREGVYGQFIQSGEDFGETPTEFLKNVAARAKKDSTRYREGWLGYEKQIQGLKEMQKRIKPIVEEGKDRSAKTFAKAALYAWDQEKAKKLDKQLYIAPENMMSEWGYGSHPDELKDLVIASRNKFAEMLQKERGLSKSEAKKQAGSHIRATFDIGHANTWAKYFEEETKLTPDQNKEKFNKWLVSKATELMEGDDPIIGHVHISDNFGYFDEHLTVGSGNAPISDFLKLLKDKEYEGKIIVERGAQGANESPGATLGAWARVAGSPVYRVEGGSSPRWTDIEHSGYFGAASSPHMMVGKYGSSLGKDWNLWTYSEAPIE